MSEKLADQVRPESDERPAPSRTRRPRARTIAGALFLVVFGALVATSLFRYSVSDHPMSFVDEHTHLDNQFKLHNGTYPLRGSLYGQEVVNIWACDVGHQAGGLPVACGDPELGADDLISGKYTTGYIHYPTFFAGGEVYRFVADAVVDAKPLDVYRSYSAFVFVLGLAVCGLLSWRLGLRGPALFAGTFAPAASSQMMLFGTIHNPMSSAILAGALIGYAAIRWVTTGRGFGWVVGATVLAAVTAVTDSLPAGAVLLAVLVALVGRRLGWRSTSGWAPRWWHAGAILAALVVPILAFGQFIARRATTPDSEIYGGYGFDSWTPVVVGAIRELSVFHNPWAEVMILEVTDNNPVKLAIRAMGYGMPETITFLVVGAAALLGFRGLRESGDDAHDDAPAASSRRTFRPLALLSGATLLGITLYPPALRITNAVQAGVDFGIVTRYSMAFAPLLVWLALLGTRQAPWFARVLAAAAAIGVGTLCVQAW